MTKPTPVTIVRPYYTGPERFGRFIAQLTVLALRAWVVMILVPYAFNITPSYLQTLAAVYAFAWFFGVKDNSFGWARLATKEDI